MVDKRRSMFNSLRGLPLGNVISPLLHLGRFTRCALALMLTLGGGIGLIYGVARQQPPTPLVAILARDTSAQGDQRCWRGVCPGISNAQLARTQLASASLDYDISQATSLDVNGGLLRTLAMDDRDAVQLATLDFTAQDRVTSITLFLPTQDSSQGLGASEGSLLIGDAWLLYGAPLASFNLWSGPENYFFQCFAGGVIITAKTPINQSLTRGQLWRVPIESVDYTIVPEPSLLELCVAPNWRGFRRVQ